MSEFPAHMLNQLITGVYDDPFSVLGMHYSAEALEVRALMPDAVSVTVIDKVSQKKVATLSLIDSRGFFVGIIPKRKKKFAYQLIVKWQSEEQRLDDPYAFGPLLQDLDSWLLSEGRHLRPYERLGAHVTQLDGVNGTVFAVWAPNAKRVSVVGDFNFWDGRRHPMRLRKESGIWELFIPAVGYNQCYKYELIDCHNNLILKADPYAFSTEMRPKTASCISILPPVVPKNKKRIQANHFSAPISIYEVHLGSWRRKENNYWLSYQELADQLIPYVQEMGFTHIELLPISEHPFDGSWGYQPTGLYAPTRRYGTTEEFIALIKTAHKAGINVLLDWVPGHFPKDQFSLAQFDGTALYEYNDPKEGVHQDWDTLIYNYGRHEVRNYLTGNALYWLERFGIDGLRVDAVASMIYRDYSRKVGEWIPNQFGGNENLEAIEFIKDTNKNVGQERLGAIMIAEESTSFAGVTLPPENNGLGFHYKWNMGWMNDTLTYMQLDPINRKHHHNLMTFGMLYAYSENFVLPLSHDEVVHGKGSLIDKMPGDAWQKFANLRSLYGFMWGYPGKKLLFMGNEFAQGKEWNCETSLDWHLLDEVNGRWHISIQQLVKDLNLCYQQHPALYQLDYDSMGMEWLVVDDNENSVFAFVRRDNNANEIIVISNFTPIPRYHYRIGIGSGQGNYCEILNTDSHHYCGSDIGNLGQVICDEIPSHGRTHSISVTVPPLATIYLLKDKL